jgi:hypothetical protein
MTNCDKGCYEVGCILFSENYDSCCDAEENESVNLSNHEAYNEIVFGEYGHINYALAAYCVKMKHIECLKKIYKNTDMLWHSDLADCAIEEDDLECLKFIVEVMGDVEIYSKHIGINCKEYVEKLGNK